MTLLNNLYTITEQVQSTFTLRLNEDHYIYKAHFPGVPITPGVNLVQIIQELLGHSLGFHVSLQSIKNVKFLSIVSPIDTPTISVELTKVQNDGKRISTQAIIKSDAGVLTKASLICTPTANAEDSDTATARLA